jgi:drug/metabolite transporter (DMT)-like permease
MTDLARPPRLQLLLAFAVVYLVWGSTYLGIAWAIESMPPMLMAAARFLLAGSVMYAWARLTGNERTTFAQWRWAALFGVLFFLIGNGAVVWVEQKLPTGLTALIVAMVSVWTALLEWFRPGGTRPSGMVLTGIGLGFLGVALLVLPGRGTGSVDPAGVGLLMCSTLAWAAASVLSREADLPKSTALVAGMEMLCGGVWLLLVSLATGEWPRLDLAAVTTRSWLAFGYLALIGSLVTFTAFAWLLKVTTPSKVSTAGYVNPMVAVFLGWALAGERLTAGTLLASAVIVASVVLIIKGKELMPFPLKAGRHVAPPGGGVTPAAAPAQSADAA